MATVLSRIEDLIQNYANGNIAEFSRLTRINYTSIKYWLDKGEANLTAENMEKICTATGVSADWLLMGDLHDLNEPKGRHRTVPILNWHAVEHWEKKVMGETKEKYLITQGNIARRAFAVSVPKKYDRMLPKIGPAEKIIIDPERKPKDGNIVVFMERGATQIARYRKIGKTDHLIFDNHEYSPIKLDRSVQLIGTVVKIIIDLV